MMSPVKGASAVLSLLQTENNVLYTAEPNASATLLLQPTVAIEGALGTGKTALLVQKTLWLLENNPHESILILSSNGYRKNKLSQALKQQLELKHRDTPFGTANLMMTTYAGLVRQTLNTFWPLVEKQLIANPSYQKGVVVIPQLSGFEATEMILGHLIDQYPLQQKLVGLKLTKKSIGRQLIRRLRLRAENVLSRDEMSKRALTAGEMGSGGVADILNQADKLAYQHRILDNGKQLEVFHKLLKTEPQIQAYIQKITQHLLVDDLDESTPSLQQFILDCIQQAEHPSQKTIWIAADPDGGTRRGYLNACPEGWQVLLKNAPFQKLNLEPQNTFDAEKLQIANALQQNWVSAKVKPIEDKIQLIQHQATSTHVLSMLDQVVYDISQKLRDGSHQPGDFVLISPNRAQFLDYLLEKNFVSKNIPLQMIRGNKRSIDHPACRYLMTLLQLLYIKQWQSFPSPTALRALLRDVLKITVLDPVGSEALIFEYRAQVLLQSTQLSDINTWHALASHLKNNQAKSVFTSFFEQLFSMASISTTEVEIITAEKIESNLYELLRLFIAPYLNEKPLSLLDLTPVKKLLESIPLYTLALSFHASQPEKAGKIWLNQLLYGAVSDTPSQPDALKQDAIILCSPQKLIDLEIKRPIHCWLDIRSQEWCRSDSAPLYNAWVYSPHWSESTPSAALHDEQLAKTRAAHITRSLVLLTQKELWAYEAESDLQGYEQMGKLPECLQSVKTDLENTPKQSKEKIAALLNGLRPDQAAVKNYEQGPMALLAPPGAGKTHTMLGLVLSLIQNGVDPEKIILLTYMDSAAKTFKKRLQSILPPNSKQPQICTIHSLAYRILTESDRAQHVGIEEIKIIDELDQQLLLQDIVAASENNRSDNHLEPLRVYDAMRGIQFFKAHNISPLTLREQLHHVPKGFRRIKQLEPVYTTYELLLAQKGYLDYTDLITRAIQLLNQDPYLLDDIQSKWQYIIEDEAQDSALLLQALIEKLSGKNNNLVRSGDPNQAITGSFSHADTEQFRHFVSQCQAHQSAIQLGQSSRSAVEIQQLANQFIRHLSDATQENNDLRHAFLPIWLEPVPSKNPALVEPIQIRLFENTQLERDAILEKIKALLADRAADKTAEKENNTLTKTIAVLCRTNRQVNDWIVYLRSQNIPAQSQGNIPQLDAVFMTIVHTFQLLRNPMSKQATYNWLKSLSETGWIELSNLLASDYPENLLEVLPESEAIDEDCQSHLELAQELFQHLITESHDITMLLVTLADVVFGTPQAKLKALLTATACQNWITELNESTEIYSHDAFELVCDQLESALARNRYPFKLPESYEDSPAESQAEIQANGFETKKIPHVIVMTLHKSKGQEFDTVFMPGLTENDFPSAPSSVSLDNSERLEAEVRYLNHTLQQPHPQKNYDLDEYKRYTQNLIREKIEEEARLIYVGLTRAKSRLFLSASEASLTKDNKSKKLKISGNLSALQQCLLTGQAQ